MPTSVTASAKVLSVTEDGGSSEIVNLGNFTSTDLSGSDFPMVGSMSLMVTNPSQLGTFVEGAAVALTFTIG